MFDHEAEHTFTIRVGGVAIAECDGKVYMDDDSGYGFIVTAIEIESIAGNQPTICLSKTSTDEFERKLFEELAAQAVVSEWLQNEFEEAREEYYEAA